MIDVSPRTIYRLAERGDIPATRVGRSVRVRTAQWLRELGLLDDTSAAH